MTSRAEPTRIKRVTSCCKERPTLRVKLQNSDLPLGSVGESPCLFIVEALGDLLITVFDSFDSYLGDLTRRLDRQLPFGRGCFPGQKVEPSRWIRLGRLSGLLLRRLALALPGFSAFRTIHAAELLPLAFSPRDSAEHGRPKQLVPQDRSDAVNHGEAQRHLKDQCSRHRHTQIFGLITGTHEQPISAPKCLLEAPAKCLLEGLRLGPLAPPRGQNVLRRDTRLDDRLLELHGSPAIAAPVSQRGNRC